MLDDGFFLLDFGVAEVDDDAGFQEAEGGQAGVVAGSGPGRVFEIYYDRAPKKQQRSGSWFLWRELEEGDDLTVEE